MEINKISFKNYKIFKDRQSLDLKPITVIIGKNNSGKSAVVKLPLLIEGALNSSRETALSILNDGVELGAELRDLVYGRGNRAIEFDLEFGDEPNQSLSVAISVSGSNSIIEKWKLGDELTLIQSDNGKYEDELNEQSYLCYFQGFKLDNYFYSEKPDSSGDILRQDFSLNTDYIGPIRTKPLRDYRQNPIGLSDKTGIEGEYAYQLLIKDALTTEKVLLTKVADWYKANFEGWELKINQDKNPIFQVEVQKDNLKQNILEAGIGMSQVLPIVTRVMQPCERETLVIIEEPETHLHPAAHANLAELFVESLEQHNKKYLIETHSLNFVLRLRRLIAEKKLSSEKLNLLYVDFDEDSNFSVIRKIHVDSEGNVDNWPEGIFNESLKEVIGITTAQNSENEDDN